MLIQSITAVVVALLELVLAAILTISATRLMWVAGSYLKRKMGQLP